MLERVGTGRGGRGGQGWTIGAHGAELGLYSKAVSPAGATLSHRTVGNVWGYFGLSPLREGGATDIFWEEAEDAVNHPAVHRAAPTAENEPVPNVSRAEVEKARSEGSRRPLEGLELGNDAIC